MKWHGYAATLLVITVAAFIIDDPMPSFDGRHLLMIIGTAWLAWSLAQPAHQPKRKNK